LWRLSGCSLTSPHGRSSTNIGIDKHWLLLYL
jgi:hypothetical protein